MLRIALASWKHRLIIEVLEIICSLNLYKYIALLYLYDQKLSLFYRFRIFIDCSMTYELWLCSYLLLSEREAKNGIDY